MEIFLSEDVVVVGRPTAASRDLVLQRLLLCVHIWKYHATTTDEPSQAYYWFTPKIVTKSTQESG